MPDTLYHYTSERGMQGILASGSLWASRRSRNPNDARYGDGQYLSDIVPGTISLPRLSLMFLGFPFQQRRFTHYIEILVSGLVVVPCRPGVFLIPSQTELDLTGRIVASGQVPILAGG